MGKLAVGEQVVAIRQILRMGDPRLREPAQVVDDFNTGELRALLRDMRDTMAAADGAGLAAPQIGVGLRVVIFGGDSDARYPGAPQVPATVLINPQIEVIDSATEEGWEGCLSVPGLRGLVPRYRAIRYSGFDETGSLLERTATDFHARVVQHECDHLDGILYPQRMRNLQSLGFEEEILAAMEPVAEPGVAEGA